MEHVYDTHQQQRQILVPPLNNNKHDLHLEAILYPLEECFKISTADQAEKYCKHPVEDLVYDLAHDSHSDQIEKHSWQWKADDMLQ
eukprot:13482558-Ditylum_brightwellii.AAC.1